MYIVLKNLPCNVFSSIYALIGQMPNLFFLVIVVKIAYVMYCIVLKLGKLFDIGR